MLLQATHTTRYLYEEPVSQCLSEARVTPRSFPGQRVASTRIEIHPEPAGMDERTDYFGNHVHSFSLFRSHDRFTTTATSVVEVEPRAPAAFPEIPWEQARDQVSANADEATLAAFEFVFESPFVVLSPELAAYGHKVFEPGRPLAEAVQELSHRIHEDFTYLPKSTSIDMPLLEVFHNRCGVCQDFSHIMIGILRSLRLPARYVSGSLRSGKNYQGAEASHAWVSAFIPGAGWLSFDPTNDVIPSDGHVTVGWGRDYGDVTPVKGIALGGGRQTVEVEVHVHPIETETTPSAL
jgi:transglutaminase-like putative cysteine protease